MKASRALVAWLMILLVGCKAHEFEPPDKVAIVAQADSIYRDRDFDTLTWAGDTERLQVGNEVYASKCDKCHGPSGGETTEYARTQRLVVPSLIKPDWPLANDVRAVRHKIFTGHPDGMPTWGVAHLTAREIDAVTAYVLEQLR